MISAIRCGGKKYTYVLISVSIIGQIGHSGSVLLSEKQVGSILCKYLIKNPICDLQTTGPFVPQCHGLNEILFIIYFKFNYKFILCTNHVVVRFNLWSVLTGPRVSAEPLSMNIIYFISS